MKINKVFILSKKQNPQIDNLLEKYQTKNMVFNIGQPYPRDSHWEFCNAFNWFVTQNYSYLTIVKDCDSKSLDMIMLIDSEVIIMDAKTKNLKRLKALLDDLYLFASLIEGITKVQKLDYTRLLGDKSVTYNAQDETFKTVVVAKISDVFDKVLHSINDDYQNNFIPMFVKERQQLRMTYIH